MKNNQILTKSFKEEFAKFCENPERTKFRELIKQNTGEYNHLDFKEIWPDIPNLAKDILGFSNAEGGILVMGVRTESSGELTIKGINSLEDKTKIKAKLQKYLPFELKYEIHDFTYNNDVEWRDIKNKKFQVLMVEDTPQYIPFLSLQTSGDILYKNRVYYRGKTNTEEVTYEELKKILNRRLDTNASTTVEDEFKEHLTQLKTLYSFIDRYYTTIPWASRYWAGNLLGIQTHNNPIFPKEDFEEFIAKMIERKKDIIGSTLRLK
jgi:predicted HTH transcriptional regulator